MNYNENPELNINKNSELENSICKIKGRQGRHSRMLSKVNNFKIFRIFNEKFIFIFCKLKGTQYFHNTLR